MKFGAASVPWTVGWSAEEKFWIGTCPIFKRPAIMQFSDPGQGKPFFGKPHSNRQREAIGLCKCDLCGRSIKASTKVSLSHAKPQPHGANGWAILQVEPMLHRECAAESCRWCPSLKRDIANGTIMIRQVHRWRAQCAIMSETYIESITGERRKALGHAKVELIKWTDRDLAWLTR